MVRRSSTGHDLDPLHGHATILPCVRLPPPIRRSLPLPSPFSLAESLVQVSVSHVPASRSGTMEAALYLALRSCLGLGCNTWCKLSGVTMLLRALSLHAARAAV
eukprot:140657-Pyramimonas_sp.AAC.1